MLVTVSLDRTVLNSLLFLRQKLRFRGVYETSQDDTHSLFTT